MLFMYCDDLSERLMGEGVSKVLGLLKVSAAILFDAGIRSCLQYLEVVPFAEEDEEKVSAAILFDAGIRSCLQYLEVVPFAEEDEEKVSAAILFDAWIGSCLQYLEVVPFAEEDEEKVVFSLCQLELDNSMPELSKSALWFRSVCSSNEEPSRPPSSASMEHFMKNQREVCIGPAAKINVKRK